MEDGGWRMADGGYVHSVTMTSQPPGSHSNPQGQGPAPPSKTRVYCSDRGLALPAVLPLAQLQVTCHQACLCLVPCSPVSSFRPQRLRTVGSVLACARPLPLPPPLSLVLPDKKMATCGLIQPELNLIILYISTAFLGNQLLGNVQLSQPSPSNPISLNSNPINSTPLHPIHSIPASSAPLLHCLERRAVPMPKNDDRNKPNEPQRAASKASGPRIEASVEAPENDSYSEGLRRLQGQEDQVRWRAAVSLMCALQPRFVWAES